MSRRLANLLLVLAAAIWGGAFVVQKMGAAHLGAMTFTGARFLIGAAVVLPLAWRALPATRLDRRTWLGMLATGGALFAGAVLQQIGINHTTATNAGFLNTLYVPLVPLLVFAAARTVPYPVVWPAAAGCVLGTWMLSGGGALAIAPGDLWVVASAVFWAVQVCLVGAVSERAGSATVVAVVQFLVCGVLSTAWGLASEPTTMAELAEAGWAIAYTGVLSVGGAFTMQAIGQRYTTAADAAVILSAEAVFAALAGALVLGEQVTAQQALGCGVILVCILAVQLLPSLFRARVA
ncbi:DMT family transporter [Azospirillum soli]|uniref:DMT family transporter n=1 Tax=Azospirillum soli TaxID=1304799 RepID=UPI001AE367EA